MRGNLFIHLSNEELLKCYESHREYYKIIDKPEKELFSNYVSKYKDILASEYNKENPDKLAEAIAWQDLTNEMSRRYYKLCTAFIETLFKS